MKDWESLETLGQSEALINELKGNLFEYLVAQSLATHFNVLSQFYHSFGGELKHRLGEYERWLRDQDPELMSRLPLLAQDVAQDIYPKLPIKKKIESVYIVGKTSANVDDDIKEADIVLIDSKKEIYPISLKLCKYGAYVNTKSGGIRSFLEKYFHIFDTIGEYSQIKSFQDELNKLLDMSFDTMGKELYEQIGENFNGTFDKRWTYSHLPGQLPENLSKIVLEHNYRVNEKLLEIFQRISQIDKTLFNSVLKNLAGFGRSDLIQVICFHGAHQGEKYHLKSVSLNIKKTESNIAYDFLPSDNVKSSFELSNGEDFLQIRIKPMNVFTSRALKVNCSVKRST
ncbi:MAG: hypothetical protein GY909_07535 [Oligoflexia bacterium]|nr:hypothetical protein [Oligoflexia bacterium]